MINERDEFDGPKLSPIEQAIEDCTAAVVTELDDGKHDELRASIRVLIDIAKKAQSDERKSAACAVMCAKAGRPTPEQLACASLTIAEFVQHIRKFEENKRALELEQALVVLFAHAQPFTEKDIDAAACAFEESSEVLSRENAMYFFVERFFGKAVHVE